MEILVQLFLGFSMSWLALLIMEILVGKTFENSVEIVRKRFQKSLIPIGIIIIILQLGKNHILLLFTSIMIIREIFDRRNIE